MNTGFKKIIFFFAAAVLCSALLITGVNLWLEEDYAKAEEETAGSSNVYLNKRLGFSVEFPYSWAFKYGIYEWDDGITVYKLNSPADCTDKLMVFFGVQRINNTFTREEAEYIESPSKYIMSSNGYTYLWRLPSREQYPSYGAASSAEIAEYSKMAENLPQIRSSIKPTELELSVCTQTQTDIMSERTGINKSLLRSGMVCFHDIVVEKYKFSDSFDGAEFDTEKAASARGIDINEYTGKRVDVYLFGSKRLDLFYIFIFDGDRLVLYEKADELQVKAANLILEKISNSRAGDIEYALKSIITSSNYSKGSFAYRSAAYTNKTEFDFLVSLGTDTLCCFGRIFAKGGQVGVRGKVMEEVCRAILADNDIKYVSKNGQDWFDRYKTHIDDAVSRFGIDEVRKRNYPGLVLIGGYLY